MRTCKWIALAGLAFLVVAPASAQSNAFKVYLAAAYVSPTGSDEVSIDNVTDRLETSSEAGWDVGFEWRLGKWAGLEFDYLHANQDVQFGGQTVADTAMSPLSASFNFHLIHTKFLDFYFGPTASYVSWDDIQDVDTGEMISADSEFGYGAQAGVDLSVMKAIAIMVQLRYTELDLAADTGETISVNPLYSKLGVAFRW